MLEYEYERLVHGCTARPMYVATRREASQLGMAAPPPLLRLSVIGAEQASAAPFASTDRLAHTELPESCYALRLGYGPLLHAPQLSPAAHYAGRA
eukprot:scaffold284320_cov36-Tisochrysis_lutea.AAC.3